MDLQERYEQMIFHANICLKRWNIQSVEDGRYRKSYQDMRSMILSWLNRVFMQYRTAAGEESRWRERKAIAKSLGKFMDFTVSEVNGIHITSVSIVENSRLGMTMPVLDYEKLNEQAELACKVSPPRSDTWLEPGKVGDVDFKEIEGIKFT